MGAVSTMGCSTRAEVDIRRQILIIDDDPFVARSLERALQLQYNVTVSATATDAIARIEAGDHFDIVLCDLNMPGMSGMSFHEWLSRRNSQLSRCTGYMTGGAIHESTRAFVKSMGNRCLAKPFQRAKLLAFVDLLSRTEDLQESA